MIDLDRNGELAKPPPQQQQQRRRQRSNNNNNDEDDDEDDHEHRRGHSSSHDRGGDRGGDRGTGKQRKGRSVPRRAATAATGGGPAAGGTSGGGGGGGGKATAELLVVSPAMLHRFLKRRRQFVASEVQVGVAAVDALMRQARKQGASQKARQKEFLSKGGSTTMDASVVNQQRCAPARVRTWRGVA